MSTKKDQPPPSDGQGVNEDDGALFAREMADVRPLDRRRRRALPPEVSEVARAPRPSAVDPPRLRELENGEQAWAYLAADVGPALLRELRAGRRRPTASLDLHGMTAVEAERALTGFVTEAQAGGQRVLLIIHGRGRGSGPDGPVLGELVRTCLSVGPLATRILAVSQAPAPLGGVGATVLLLRKR